MTEEKSNSEGSFDDEEGLSDVSESGIEEIVEKDMEKAQELKTKGNELFTSRKSEEARDIYTEAIKYCPEDSDKGQELLSTLFGNRAACFLSLNNFDSTIEDCNKAIELNATYLKVYRRRAQAYEKKEEYERAIEDLSEVMKLDSTQYETARKIQELQKLNKDKQEKMKEEVFGKLKELGNSFLGNFGMSLNNFQAVQDPKTGGYSISYNPNAPAP